MILSMCSSRQLVLPLALLEVLGGVDEQHVVRLLALLQHEDADRDAGGIEQVRRQADHGVDVPVLQQLACGCAPPRRRGTARRAAG